MRHEFQAVQVPKSKIERHLMDLCLYRTVFSATRFHIIGQDSHVSEETVWNHIIVYRDLLRRPNFQISANCPRFQCAPRPIAIVRVKVRLSNLLKEDIWANCLEYLQQFVFTA